MKTRITLRKLALELDVAPSTVLRALSGQPRIRPDLRKKIVDLAAFHGYVLPNHCTGNIAVVTATETMRNYTSTMLQFLAKELHSQGFRTYILSEHDMGGFNDYIYDGIISITWACGIEKSFPETHYLPFVSVNSMDNPSENIFTVCSDEANGIMSGLQYLYDTGHRKIVFITSKPKGNRIISERIAAFQHFCELHAMDGKEIGTLLCSEDILGKELVRSVIETGADAVFYAWEGAGPALYHEFRKKGIRIPNDISVMGLEWPEINQYLDPPLTSMRQDFEGLAKEGVSMLRKIISGKRIRSGVKLPYTLIERESVKKRLG